MIKINTLARCFVMVLLMLPVALNAQNKITMSAWQNELNQLFEQVVSAPTDNERYHANEQALTVFREALAHDNSFFWQWDFGTKVSVLTAPDKKFRIITWPVVRDNGEYECFGFVQAYDDHDERYVVYVLNDKSEDLLNLEESLFDPENWLGSVYQDLVVTKHDGHTFYTLIGWTGCDNLTQRKVIEPIYFRNNSSKPIFGQALFRRDKNRRRVVLEYSRTASVVVKYDEQFVRTVVNKKVKGKKGRVYNVQEPHDEKKKMIIFDEIAPMIVGMEGLYQYYVPTGTEQAYVFREGKWELNNNAQGRDANQRLNKEFAPLPKDAPAYKVSSSDDEE